MRRGSYSAAAPRGDAGERCLLETPLARLEAQLDPALFFRASRQPPAAGRQLLSAAAVVRFPPAGKGRLRLELRPALVADVHISQERAAAFRAWIGS